MHNKNEYKYTLSKYRLEKAQESLKYAKILMDNDGYAETVNRAYYSIFHATRAILAIDGVDRKNIRALFHISKKTMSKQEFLIKSALIY